MKEILVALDGCTQCTIQFIYLLYKIKKLDLEIFSFFNLLWACKNINFT